MKWFKHENTFNNAKIEMLTDKHGILGYGIYFRTLELIASAIEESNPEEWGYLPSIYTTQYLAKKLQTSEEALDSVFETCFELGLLETKDGNIYCSKVLERCDDYTQRLLKQNEKKVGTKSEQSPTKNRIEKNKNRKEEKRRENTNVTNVTVAPQFGDPHINEISQHFLQVFQIPKEDCTQQQSRRYWHLLLKESQKGAEGVKWLIDLASKDEFYRNNITSSKDLYYKRMKVIARKRGDTAKISVQT